MSGPSNLHDLDRLQRWMQSVIMHPNGVQAGIDSHAARQHVEVESHDAERIVTRSSALSAMERIAIYGRAYYSRLLECLQQEFPVLKAAIGDEAFDAFAFGYLQQYPSQSYTLGRLSERFAQYLDETRPATDDSDGHPEWADFVVDLARFESTISEVFDGPGIETSAPLTADDLLQVSQET